MQLIVFFFFAINLSKLRIQFLFFYHLLTERKYFTASVECLNSQQYYSCILGPLLSKISELFICEVDHLVLIQQSSEPSLKATILVKTLNYLL